MHYLKYFGLDEKPFELTPNPKYLYLSDEYRRGFEHLLYGIRNREGFLVVTGEIGTGKTTLLRTVLGCLRDERWRTAFVFNPSLSAEELLQVILEDFGIEVESSMSKKEMMDRLNEFLLEQLRKGRHAVVLIDEAQNLAPSVLEEIRLLTNLETESQKLLQVVLFGQPELRDILNYPDLVQLNQRVAVRYHLEPLPFRHVGRYVRHRLTVAGNNGRVEFTPWALYRLYRYSGGVPRLINKACDKALLAGYLDRSEKITGGMVREGIDAVEGKQRSGVLGLGL
ncbi:MAG: ExeA family protein [Gemmatimonadota bacterium]